MLWAKYGEKWGLPPAGMTAEGDRKDLARQADEMVTHESFNYAIMPSDESAVWRCIYIGPPDLHAEVNPLEADVSRWVVAVALIGVSDAVAAFVPGWLERDFPFGAVRYPFGEVAEARLSAARTSRRKWKQIPRYHSRLELTAYVQVRNHLTTAPLRREST
jgi:hypothetical protein